MSHLKCFEYCSTKILSKRDYIVLMSSHVSVKIEWGKELYSQRFVNSQYSMVLIIIDTCYHALLYAFSTSLSLSWKILPMWSRKKHMGKSLWIYVYFFTNDKFNIIKYDLFQQREKIGDFFELQGIWEIICYFNCYQ